MRKSALIGVAQLWSWSCGTCAVAGKWTAGGGIFAFDFFPGSFFRVLD